MFEPEPNYEEEYWNILYYYKCLDEKHRKAILKELKELKT